MMRFPSLARYLLFFWIFGSVPSQACVDDPFFEVLFRTYEEEKQLSPEMLPYSIMHYIKPFVLQLRDPETDASNFALVTHAYVDAQMEFGRPYPLICVLEAVSLLSEIFHPGLTSKEYKRALNQMFVDNKKIHDLPILKPFHPNQVGFNPTHSKLKNLVKVFETTNIEFIPVEFKDYFIKLAKEVVGVIQNESPDLLTLPKEHLAATLLQIMEPRLYANAMAFPNGFDNKMIFIKHFFVPNIDNMIVEELSHVVQDATWNVDHLFTLFLNHIKDRHIQVENVADRIASFSVKFLDRNTYYPDYRKSVYSKILLQSSPEVLWAFLNYYPYITEFHGDVMGGFLKPGQLDAREYQKIHDFTVAAYGEAANMFNVDAVPYFPSPDITVQWINELDSNPRSP